MENTMEFNQMVKKLLTDLLEKRRIDLEVIDNQKKEKVVTKYIVLNEDYDAILYKLNCFSTKHFTLGACECATHNTWNEDDYLTKDRLVTTINNYVTCKLSEEKERETYRQEIYSLLKNI
jgi:hypothetical protein